VPSGGETLVTTTTFVEGYDVKTRFFDQINVKYYINDNWAGYLGHRYQGGKHALALGSEIVIPLDQQLATTAFVEGRVGSGDFEGIWGGLKFYFGHQGKSLIRRHRENDDPPAWYNIFAITNSSTSSTTTSLHCTGGEVVIDGVCTSPGGEQPD
jgi:hypothetical protein